MARKMLIAGNWKMNGLTADGVALATEIKAAVKAKKRSCEFLVCPPFTLLTSVKKALKGCRVALGAQDCHFNEKGAHTGDVSPLMLVDAGCSYVILGHSERRADHGESNELVCKKAEAANKAGLKTVICIGETLEQRDNGQTVAVCSEQVLGSVPASATAADTVIAYEPVWAIGTGKTPTAEDVEEVHAAVRKVLAKKLGRKEANRMRILYGGSVKPSNAKEFLSLPDVDGALIGGASLKSADFIAIADNAEC
jgi:triosephosphate isomerase